MGTDRAAVATDARPGPRLFVARGSSRHAWSTHREVSNVSRVLTRRERHARLYIREPSPRSPRPLRALASSCVWGKGFSGSEPPVDFCKRDNGVRAHPRASIPRPPRDHEPLAEPMIPWRSPCVCSTGFPLEHAAGVRAAEARLGRIRPSHPRLATRIEVQPRTGRPGAKGPQPFRLVAGVPSPKPAEHPLSSARCPRSLECPRARLTWPFASGFSDGEGPRSASRADLGLRSDDPPRRRAPFFRPRMLSTDRRRAKR